MRPARPDEELPPGSRVATDEDEEITLPRWHRVAELLRSKETEKPEPPEKPKRKQ